jgi:membrane-associated phospholipid phosphatase
MLYHQFSTPHQTIDGGSLVMFGLTLPAFLLLLRIVLWWAFSFRILPSPLWSAFTYKFWLFMTYESMLALIYSSTYQTIVMEYIKSSVGAPRPIYHALNIWASVGFNRQGWLTESHRSFPSGHSSTISSGMGIVILLMLHDAYQIQSYSPAAAKILAHISVLPFSLIIHVGISRIRDYWHFPIDVAVGWAMGALSAAFTFMFLTGESGRIFKYLINEHSDKSPDIQHVSDIEREREMYR